MAHDCKITQSLLEAQKEMFREAGNRGFTHKVIHSRTKLSLSIIGQYSRGETAMSGPSIIKMIGLIPLDLISLLYPSNIQIVEASDEIDHDAFCEMARDYFDAKVKAHRADSPAGPAICPVQEQPDLDVRATRLRSAK